MTRLSALSISVAAALALVSGASTAQDRPNTTLVQKAKAKAAKNVSQSPVQANDGSGRVDARRVAPTATHTAPAAEDAYHECPGRASDA